MTLALVLWTGVNVVAFLAFGWDKQRSVTRQSRVPERTLLTLALFGGAFGALLGQQMFRHKTRKQPFGALLWGAAAINLIVAVALLSS